MATPEVGLARRALAEGLGTCFLLAVVIGSGVMGERLASGNVALALLANALATGAALLALIQVFAPVSGAHFNPAVSLAMVLRRAISVPDALAYAAAQIVGALLGVAAAHAMFDLPLLSTSMHAREGVAQVWSEFVATFGLVLVVLGTMRQSIMVTATSVAAYITAAYWFTASTSFANPAVTVARGFSDTFAGIAWPGVPWFVLAQVLGCLSAVGVGAVVFRERRIGA